MKRNIRHMIGILFALVLLCTNVQWPAPIVSAASEAGTTTENAVGVAEEGLAAAEASAALSSGELQLLADEWKPMLARTSENLDPETMEWVEMAGDELAAIAEERDIRALVYLSDTFPIRAVPKWDSQVVVTVLSGQLVNIVDVYVDDFYAIWMCVSLEYKGQKLHGYVPVDNLACSDSRFLNWQDMYGFGSRATYALDGRGNMTYADIEQFPESYKPALLALKEKYPNWTFAKFNTTLDWNEVVAAQLKGGKSLVYKTLPDWAKEGLYDNGTWYYASEAALKLYLDPRNALTENAIFQFEELTYNAEYHSEEALRSFLNNTFMNDSQNAPGTVMTYHTIFWALATEESKRDVSPFHLVARVVQEQGTNGGSALISGTYPGYEGYYNYFNIGATGTTSDEVILNGLKYAKDNWKQGAYYAIMYGADFIAGNYIEKGQNTLYLQKYNVNPNGYYAVHTHQYMQNISAPTTEAANIKRLYAEANALSSPFVFSIPVYENMPAEACGEPQVSTNVVLDLPAGYTDTTMWLDGVAYEGEIRNEKLIVTAPDGTSKTAVLYKYDVNGTPIGMYVWELGYNGMAYTATALPGLEDLLTYHGFSIRITGKSGIRVKTGISTELRRTLTSTGVNGYTLKEYGTLLMADSNRERYPMVYGGEKIKTGMAYGLNADGSRKDVVYETKSGRYRYTSVLTGLPVEQYKTAFAFRGYAILEKNGARTIIYGPIVSRSIYALAEQILDAGGYQQGTTAYDFLSAIIADADALENTQESPDEKPEENQGEQPTVSGGDAAIEEQPTVSGGDAATEGQPTVSGGNAAE